MPSPPWIELWPRPGADNYRKLIADLPVLEASVSVPYSGVGKGSMSVKADYDRLGEILQVDPVDGVDSVWSTIKVFDEDGWLYEWLPGPLTPQDGSKDGIRVEIVGEGLESMWGFARVEPWDWDGSASFVSTFPDWIWGGRNLLQNPGFENPGKSPIIDELWIGLEEEYPDETWLKEDIQEWLTDHDIAWDDTMTEAELLALISVPTISGTYFLGDGTNNTDPIAADEDNPVIIEAELEEAGIYDDVLVTGTGTEDDPFVIEAVEPFEGVTLTVGTGLLVNGIADIVRRQFGSLQPTGWTRSTRLTAVEKFFGSYASFRVVDDQAHSGIYSLRIDPNPVLGQNSRYAGAQQVVSVQPNGLYQASVWIYPTSGTDRFRFVIRGIDGDFLKSSTGGLSSTTLTPNTWNEMTISDIDVGNNTSIIFRVAVTNGIGDDPAPFYIDDAEFNEGMAATTVGDMLTQLYEDATIDHAPSRIVWEDEAGTPGQVYLSLDFTPVLDSNGNFWDRDDVNHTFNPRMSYLQVIDQIVEEGGYDWRVVPYPDPDVIGWYVLQVYNPGDLGELQEAGIVGGSTDTSRQAKFVAPVATEMVAEGDENMFERASTPGLLAAFGRIEGSILDQNWVTPSSILSAAQTALDENMRGAESIVYNLSSPAQRPLVAYRPGDRIRVNDLPVVNENRRVQQIQLSMTKNEPEQFTVHISDALPFRAVGGAGPILTRGLQGQAATDNAVAALLKAFKKANRRPARAAPIPGAGGELTVVVAASDATDISRSKADLIGDDTAVLNEAAAMAVGGRVVLSEGTFVISRDLFLPGNTVIQGSGSETTLVIDPTATLNIGIGGGLQDLQLQVNSDSGGDVAVDMAEASFIQNVYSDDLGQRDAYVQLGDGCRIDGWTMYTGVVEDAGGFFLGVGVDGVTIRNIRITNGLSDGPIVRLTNCTHVTIENVQCNNVNSELWMTDCQHVTVSKWHSVSGGSGAYPGHRVINSEAVSFDECKFASPTAEGSSGSLGSLTYFSVEGSSRVVMGRSNVFAHGVGGPGESGSYITLEDSTRCAIGPTFAGHGGVSGMTEWDFLRLVNADFNFLIGGDYQPYGIDANSDNNVVFGNFFGHDITRWLDDPISDLGTNTRMVPSGDPYGHNFVPGTFDGGGGASELDDLTDVDLTGLADGDFLQYDAGAGEWVPVSLGEAQLLGEVIADGSSASLTISSLPQTHRDLLVLIHGSHPAASGQQLRNVTLRFNNDSGTNYRFVRVDTDDNGNPTRASGLGATGIIIGSFGDDTDLSFARFEVPNYSSARNHPTTFQSGASFGGSAGQSRSADGWGTHIDASAITRIDAIMTTENWRSGSVMTVYGLPALGSGAGTDSTAIHDNVAAEISAITEKTTPVSGDWLLIEDSAASDAKKKVQVGNLPGGSGGIGEGRPSDGSTLFSLTKPGVTFITSGTFATTVDTVRYEPFLTQIEIEVDGLIVEVTAGQTAGRLLRVGIYECDYDLQPGALVVEGELDCTTTGIKTLSVSEVLPPGRYLTALNSNNSLITVRSFSSASLIGLRDTLTATGFIANLRATTGVAYGALDDPGVAWDQMTYNSSGGLVHTTFLRLVTPA